MTFCHHPVKLQEGNVLCLVRLLVFLSVYLSTECNPLALNIQGPTAMPPLTCSNLITHISTYNHPSPIKKFKIVYLDFNTEALPTHPRRCSNLFPRTSHSSCIKPDMPINVYARFCLSTAKSKFSLVSPVAD